MALSETTPVERGAFLTEETGAPWAPASWMELLIVYVLCLNISWEFLKEIFAGSCSPGLLSSAPLPSSSPFLYPGSSVFYIFFSGLTEVITHFVRLAVFSKVEDYDFSWGLISLSRCILSKRDTVLMRMSPLIQSRGDMDRRWHCS